MIPLIPDLTHFAFTQALKPVLFAIPPDQIHERALVLGKMTGSLPVVPDIMKWLYSYQHPALAQTVSGIDFSNPVGLSAGYDYEAYMPSITPSLGFGFQSIGSITAAAYGGNEPPMYGRLPKSQSLWVNKGFKNPGADEIAQRLQGVTAKIPIGISVGATNKEYTNRTELIAEYERAFTKLRPLTNVSYFELNISCPNLRTTISFAEKKNLIALLKMLDDLHLTAPVFLKMPVDSSVPEHLSLVDTATKHAIAGVIIGNLTKKRSGNPHMWQSEVAKTPLHGGFSGKPVAALSNTLIKATYQNFGSSVPIIGCGGIFSAADAYQRVKMGATLLQLITGMIYEGPQLIGKINHGLVKLLHQDGLNHISESVGLDA